MSESICPVCNQSGISNFRKAHTLCPQCNTDLKPYFLLESIRTKTKTNLLMPAISVLVLVSIIFAFIFSTSSQRYNADIERSKVIIAALRDSIVSLEQKSSTTTASAEQTKQDRMVEIKYTVKRGDNLWKIAEFFYGDGLRFNEIYSINDLKSPNELEVGQQLIIQINQ